MTIFDDDRTAPATETEAAAELAATPELIPLDAGAVGVLVLPPGWKREDIDERDLLPAPTRSAGTIAVHDAASFIAAVDRRTGDDDERAVVYYDEERLALVAVLNDDGGPAAPGWRDYRVELALRPTPEWTHWAGSDGRMMGQEAFAEHVEAGLAELRHPDAATMLDIAQTFHAQVNTKVRSGTRLASGEVKLVFDEEHEASAGAGGDVVIPTELLLVVKPFIGGPAYELGARFRYRLPRGGGEVSMGYLLNRPHEVKRAAFLGDEAAGGSNPGVLGTVRAGLPGALFIGGPAPAVAAGI